MMEDLLGVGALKKVEAEIQGRAGLLSGGSNSTGIALPILLLSYRLGGEVYPLLSLEPLRIKDSNLQNLKDLGINLGSPEVLDLRVHLLLIGLTSDYSTY